MLELPTSWSKRALYARFCYERGYVVTASHSGILTKEERTDDGWDVANNKRTCGWSTFLRFWEKHYPSIRLGSSSADICTDCHVFFNRSKHAGASDNVEAETDAVVNELAAPLATTTLILVLLPPDCYHW